jgi:magnesium-transporting ATPase (P-type)
LRLRESRSGQARRPDAVVTATGMATEFGRIAELAQGAHEAPSPLELELRRVTRFVAALSIGFGATFFLVAGWLGMGLSARFTFAIGVMVANVPEGLLPTVTLSLALGTQRMARRNALVRRLSSVETLGATTVICTDKTGTLTENQMTVERVWTPDGTWYDVEGAGYEPFGRFLHDGHAADPRRFRELLRAGLLCNDARLTAGPSGVEIAGDPTEAALVVLAEKGGLRHEREAALRPRVAEVPFDSARRRMATVHLFRGERVAYAKGAAEEIVARSTLPEDARHAALAAAEEMERNALRVLAVARRTLPAQAATDAEHVERDYELLGVVGMLDPPRPEVTGAIASCRAAGIRILMVTGDSGWTAEAVARRIGLVGGGVHVVGPQAVVHGHREVQVIGPRTRAAARAVALALPRRLAAARLRRGGGPQGVRASRAARFVGSRRAGPEPLRCVSPALGRSSLWVMSFLSLIARNLRADARDRDPPRDRLAQPKNHAADLSRCRPGRRALSRLPRRAALADGGAAL